MTKHAPAAITFTLSLIAATALLASAPSADVDVVTPTPLAQTLGLNERKPLPEGLRKSPAEIRHRQRTQLASGAD
jgi:hypothetical protein